MNFKGFKICRKGRKKNRGNLIFVGSGISMNIYLLLRRLRWDIKTFVRATSALKMTDTADL